MKPTAMKKKKPKVRGGKAKEAMVGVGGMTKKKRKRGGAVKKK